MMDDLELSLVDMKRKARLVVNLTQVASFE